MSGRLIVTVAVGIGACAGERSCETDVRPPDRLALSLTDPRFTVGALGLLGEDGVDVVQGISSDALVRTDGDRLYVLGRSDEDTVRAFDPARPGCPLWETALPPRANAHDLIAAAGKLWVPTFGTGELLVLDPADGALLDRLPVGQTLDRVVLHDGSLWVADQRWDVDRRQEGALIEVDPVAERVVGTLPAGPNPRLSPAVDGIYVASGYFAFAEETYEADLRDGALHHLDPRAERWTRLLTEDELGGDVHAVIPHGGGAVVVAVDADARSQVHCLSEQRVEGPADAGWLLAGAVVGERIAIGVRSSLIAGEQLSTPGILWLDPAGCTQEAFLPTELEPYDLVALP